jgi:hypothetical protein
MVFQQNSIKTIIIIISFPKSTCAFIESMEVHTTKQKRCFWESPPENPKKKNGISIFF